MKPIAPVLALVVLAALTACDRTPAEPGAEPTVPGPESSSSAEPTEQPVDNTDPVADSILITTLTFAILDEEGSVLHEYDYFDPAAPVIADLTTLLGSAPVATPFEGHTHQWPGTDYTWGGFTLKDWDGPAVAYGQDFDIIVSSAAVHGLDVVTVGGIHVGSTTAEATAAGGSYQDTIFDFAIDPMFEMDSMLAPDPEWAEWYGGPRRYVYAHLTGADGTVDSLGAPYVNYGP